MLRLAIRIYFALPPLREAWAEGVRAGFDESTEWEALLPLPSEIVWSISCASRQSREPSWIEVH